MSATTAAIEPAPPALGRFERWLSAWVALCIVAGIGFGRLFPQAFATIGNAQFAFFDAYDVESLAWFESIAATRTADRRWR